MNCREKTMYKTITGMIASMSAASRAVQSVLYCPANEDKPEVTVRTASPGAKVSGNHKSFQIGIMLKTSTVASAGLSLSFTAPARTTLVRVAVFRVGSKRPLVKQFIRVKRGKTTTKLRTAAMKRALHLRGHYRIEITPGSSRMALGKTAVRMVTVRR